MPPKKKIVKKSVNNQGLIIEGSSNKLENIVSTDNEMIIRGSTQEEEETEEVNNQGFMVKGEGIDAKGLTSKDNKMEVAYEVEDEEVTSIKTSADGTEISTITQQLEMKLSVTDATLRRSEEEVKHLREQLDKPTQQFNFVGGSQTGVNIATGDSASQSNQIVYHVQYNSEKSKVELDNVKKKYQELESISEGQTDFHSDLPKLKKAILFLGAKRIFSVSRQNTIKSLIETYEKSDKSVKRYEKIETIGNYMDTAGDIASIFPPAGISIKLLGKGIPIITNLLKDHSLASHAGKFEDYLMEDEKSLLLLQQTYQSLVKSIGDEQNKMSSALNELFNLNRGQLSEYSVFIVSEIPRENASLNVEGMKKAIDLLDKHFVEFTQELRKEAEQQVEKLEEIFKQVNSDILQNELTELLERLAGKERDNKANLVGNQELLSKQIESKNADLQNLVTDANTKLETKGLPIFNKEKKIEERKLFFKTFLDDPRKLTVLHKKELLKSKMTEEQLNKIHQTQVELAELQAELANLLKQEKQAQIQIPPK